MSDKKDRPRKTDGERAVEEGFKLALGPIGMMIDLADAVTSPSKKD